MTARIGSYAFALLPALLLSFALAGNAIAQARVEEKVNLAVTGEITALDADARRITVKSTNDEGIVYTVDGSATIMRGAQNVKLEDLRVGWSVVLNGHRTGESRLVTLIKVVKAP